MYKICNPLHRSELKFSTKIHQTFFKLFKNDKIVTTFLLKFWDLSGAKVWKSCRSRKSWKNEYLVAIVAVDTAENGPPKVWRNWIIYSVVSLTTAQLRMQPRRRLRRPRRTLRISRAREFNTSDRTLWDVRIGFEYRTPSSWSLLLLQYLVWIQSRHTYSYWVHLQAW